MRRLYEYENIGNRQTDTTAMLGTSHYCANAVNQYETVGFDPDCPAAEPTFAFDYDNDGNLALMTNAGATFWYAWDGENRLIKAGSGSAEQPEQGNMLLEFQYDYLNRRVEKRYRVYDDGTWTDQPGGWQRYVYDGWNVVLVLDGLDDNAVVRKYSWGLDLSGWSGDARPSGTHGAGGIGGLLAAVETSGTHAGSYWYLYDANGSVGQVLNATDPQSITPAAHYEYDPYGNTVAKSGTYADYNPFRFSTKWRDDETGLYYYGYRYYSPGLGRWISRDPIEEEGGLHLYAFVQNQVPGKLDKLGQHEVVTHPGTGYPIYYQRSSCVRRINVYGHGTPHGLQDETGLRHFTSVHLKKACDYPCVCDAKMVFYHCYAGLHQEELREMILAHCPGVKKICGCTSTTRAKWWLPKSQCDGWWRCMDIDTRVISWPLWP